jgi:GT2 family glycosyltransferase
MKDDGLSVIVPTFSRPECLAACLAALTRQTQSPAAVIVVNDGDGDVSGIAGKFAQELPVTLIGSGRVGPAAARNQALALVTTTCVAFLDDDSCPADHWVSACAALFQRQPEVMAQLGRILWAGPMGRKGFRQCFLPSFRQKIFDSRHLEYTDAGFRRRLAAAMRRDIPASLPGVATHLSGGNSALRMEFVMKYGGFDMRFRTLSDREMAWRILRAGGLIAYNPEMQVLHRHDPSLRRALRRCFLTAPYQKLLAREYPDPPWAHLTTAEHGGGRWKDPIRCRLTAAERIYLVLHAMVQRLGLLLTAPLAQDPLGTGKGRESHL